MDKRLEQLSKRLSYVLRHNPSSIDVKLSTDGWVDIDALLSGLRDAGQDVGLADLEQLLATSPKKRFEIASGRIRAAQGHSIGVQLGLGASMPPTSLFHGTVGRFLKSISTEGLRPMRRDHVHLSADRETASDVGQRRGKPLILVVDAARMHADGFEFYLAANGVWLTKHVPSRYLTIPPH